MSVRACGCHRVPGVPRQGIRTHRTALDLADATGGVDTSPGVANHRFVDMHRGLPRLGRGGLVRGLSGLVGLGLGAGAVLYCAVAFGP